MSSNLKSIMINMILLGIVIFAIMNFIIIIQSDSKLNAEDRITNNSLINESFGDLQNTLNKQEEAQDALDTLGDSPPTEYAGDLSVFSLISTTIATKGIITGLWTIYIKLPQVILGVSPVVAGAINTILLILIAIGIWAWWKGAISS